MLSFFNMELASSDELKAFFSGEKLDDVDDTIEDSDGNFVLLQPSAEHLHDSGRSLDLLFMKLNQHVSAPKPLTWKELSEDLGKIVSNEQLSYSTLNPEQAASETDEDSPTPDNKSSVIVNTESVLRVQNSLDELDALRQQLDNELALLRSSGNQAFDAFENLQKHQSVSSSVESRDSKAKNPLTSLLDTISEAQLMLNSNDSLSTSSTRKRSTAKHKLDSVDAASLSSFSYNEAEQPEESFDIEQRKFPSKGTSSVFASSTANVPSQAAEQQEETFNIALHSKSSKNIPTGIDARKLQVLPPGKQQHLIKPVNNNKSSEGDEQLSTSKKLRLTNFATEESSGNAVEAAGWEAEDFSDIE